jgi:beta-mannanase
VLRSVLSLSAVVIIGLVVSVLLYHHAHPKPPSAIAPTATTPMTAPTTSQTVLPASSVHGVVLGLDTPVSNESRAIAQIGRTPSIIDAFSTWENGDGNYIGFPRTWVDSVEALGSTPMITWEPSNGKPKAGVSQPTFDLSTIASGRYDTFIRAWASSARADGRNLYVRLMHEMNGGWYPWGRAVDGNTPAQYVTAFRHVVDIFRQEGADNVQFVWCVASGSSGKHVQTSVSDYFPGNAYVSWVAMDGYNRSVAHPLSFEQIFSTTYSTLTSISDRPIMIAETGSVQYPGKSQWITTGFLTTLPTAFPRVKAVDYFDSRGAVDNYSITTSPASLSAIRQLYSNATFQAKAPTTTLVW